MKPTVLAYVCTKDRYDILSNCLQSLAVQTTLPDKIIIFDDGEQKDLRQMPIYQHLFKLFDLKGIAWEVKFPPKRGQHYAHQIANTMDFDYLWRIDDDEIAEPDVLTSLLEHIITSEIGAVAGAVYDPLNIIKGGTNKLADIFHTPNIQWAPGNQIVEVEHLYSSFLYRPKIAAYNLDLSPVAHREETMFTHDMFLKGYKLIVDTSIKTYHFRHSTGGIRSHDSEFFYNHDNKIFLDYLENKGIKVVSLNTGLGDHFAFLNIVPDLLKKHKTLILGCCYPAVFKDYPVITVPLAATENLRKDRDHIYKWCIDHNWKRSIVDAYKQMLGVA